MPAEAVHLVPAQWWSAAVLLVPHDSVMDHVHLSIHTAGLWHLVSSAFLLCLGLTPSCYPARSEAQAQTAGDIQTSLLTQSFFSEQSWQDNPQRNPNRKREKFSSINCELHRAVPSV